MKNQRQSSATATDPRGERGASLVLVLSLMLLLTFLATSLLFTSDVEFKTGKSYNDNLTTLTDVDSAIAEVVWRLNLTQGAAAPPTGSTISVNSLSNFDAKINPDPFGLLTNEIDDDANGVIDDPHEIKYMKDWTARILLTTTETHPGSPYEIADSDAFTAPWGPTLVTPTVQPASSWRRYTVDTASSPDVMTLRYKLDTDVPTVMDSEGDDTEPVFYSSRMVTNGRDDKNSLNQLGGNGNGTDDSPYNITWADAGVTTWAMGSPVLLLTGTSRMLRAGKEVGRRKFEAELYYPVRPVMNKALCACGDYDGHGGPTTDSYKSSDGAYADAGVPHYENGDIGANGNIESDGVINGKADAGGWITGADTIAGDNTAGGSVTGTPFGAGSMTYPNTFPPPMPCECGAFDVVTLVDSKTTLPAPPDPDCDYPAMHLVAGKVCTLTAGEYYFTSMSVSGGAYIEIDASAGPVTIYCSGDASFNGNGIINTSKPADFRFFGTGDDFKISGTADLRGTFYVPLSNATLTGNGDLQGAVLAKTVAFGGTNDVHFDEDLADLWTVRGEYKVLNWKETD